MEFLGLRFDNINVDQAMEKIFRLSKSSSFSYVVTPNVDHIVNLYTSSQNEVADSFKEADLTLCDSRILRFLAKMKGLRLRVVPGSDLTVALLSACEARKSIAVVGGNRGLHDALVQKHPSLKWHFHEPPMGVRASEAARREIGKFVRGANADIILFAIGAPQSEMTCAEIQREPGARGVALCIGASLEFHVDRKRRAPIWVQRIAMEWLFRLMTEPERLWRRYLIDGPKIISIWRAWRPKDATRFSDVSGSTRIDDEKGN